MSPRFLVAMVISTSWLGAHDSSAQSDQEINGNIQFNFLNPGARSLGMGGAFLGLADDATAAFTNPAGLTMLRNLEFSFEGRSFDFNHLFLDGGRTINSVPTGVPIDTLEGLVTRKSEDRVKGLSFLSFVYPGSGWAVAIYRRQAANFTAERIQSQGAFLFDETTDVFRSPLRAADRVRHVRLLPYEANLRLDLVDLGVSGAVRLGGGFSVGGGLSFYDFEMSSTTRRLKFANTSNGQALITPILFDPNTRLPGNLLGSFDPVDFGTAQVAQATFQQGSDSDTAINAGFHWSVNRMWNVGGVFRQGPDFGLSIGTVTGVPGVFHVPDVYGLGFSFRPIDALSISVDYDRVQYSQLARDIVLGVSEQGLMTSPEDWTIDDADEFHFGFEYFLSRRGFKFLFRVGFWNDPDHKLRYDGDDSFLTRVSFPPGQDHFHYSGGLGFVFGNLFQIDVGLDYSRLVTTAAFSAVFYPLRAF